MQLNIFLGLLARARGQQRPALDGSPYRGLSAFRERDAAVFFGREKAVRQVLARMAGCLEHPGLLVVSGASGAGKSSLLSAGVIPRLADEGLPSDVGADAASWPRVALTPGQDPLGELAGSVASSARTDAGLVRRALAASPEGFALTARQAVLARRGGQADPGRGRLIVVVDQFEQLFTAGADETGQRAFIAALHAAATEPQGEHGTPAALVVLVVRADFETRCAAEPELIEAVRDRYLLTGMGRADLRRAITGPAAAIGASVEPALTEVLLAEISARRSTGRSGPVAGQGVLPLLSHALDQAWQQRVGQALTLADYERTGGMDTAVARSAQEAYDALGPARRDIARRLFTLLTVTSPDGTDAAVPLDGAALAAGLADAQADDVAAVLEAFTASRLLTLGADSVEITHEVLLTAWPLLRDTWLAEGRSDRLIRGGLRIAAGEWATHRQDPAYLYKGSLLEAATEADGRSLTDPGRYLPLLPAERTFLAASQRSARRRIRRLRLTIAGLTALAVALAASTGTAVGFYRSAAAARNTANAASNEASLQRTLADSGGLAAQSGASGDTDPVMARLEAVAAWHVKPTPTARDAMLAAAFVPWTAELSIPAIPPVTSIAFSPVRDLVAAGADNGTVLLWDPASRQPRAVLRSGDSSSIVAVAFSGDGSRLAAVSANDSVRLWNVAAPTPAPTKLYAPAPVKLGQLGPSADSAAFSRDSRFLAVGMSNGTQLWNLTSGTMALLRDGRDSASVSSVAFSPDGSLLAVGTYNGTVTLWSVARHATQATFSVRQPGKEFPENAAFSVAFRADGTQMAVGTGHGSIELWDVPSPGRAPVATFMATGASSEVWSVRFSGNSPLLAAGTSDGKLELWDVTAAARTPKKVLPLEADNNVTVIAFSRTGRLLAADTGTSTQVWDISTGKMVTFVPGSANSMTLSGDGSTLAVGIGQQVQLWDTGASRRIGELQLSGGVGPGEGLMAFSQDGTKLAVGAGEATELWNVPYLKDPATYLCTLAAQPFPKDLWQRDVPGIAYQPTCPARNAIAHLSANLRETERLAQPVSIPEYGPRTGKAVTCCPQAPTARSRSWSCGRSGNCSAASGGTGSGIPMPPRQNRTSASATSSGLVESMPRFWL